MVLHIFWDGWVCRKYSSNTIDNEWFNIYSRVDGSVGNILQTQIVFEEYFLQTHPPENIY
jgi:hypothetical protein